jgi:hypothetical protein
MNRQRAVDDFNKRYEKLLVSNDFDEGMWVLVHETWLDTQKGNKGAVRWTGPFIINERVVHEGKLKGYRLRELDGTIRRGTVALDRVKIFYYRSEHQTIKTYQASRYACLAREFPDPTPLLHSEVYRRGLALVDASYHFHSLSRSPSQFESHVPILDVSCALANLGVTALRALEDWELLDLSVHRPVNYDLVYEPFLMTNISRKTGCRQRHLMIGDLENMFQSGVDEVYIECHPRTVPAWRGVEIRMVHNVGELAKWTDEMMELRPNFR